MMKISCPSIIRNAMLAGAIVSSAATVASGLQATGFAKKENIGIAEDIIYNLDKMIHNEFKYNDSISLSDNIAYNSKVLDYKIDDSIENACKNPALPLTTTALLSLGVLATKPKENGVVVQNENKQD